MLIFGGSVSDWQAKADYCQDKADNEFAEIREIRCEGMNDPQTVMAAWAGFAAGTKCKQFIYHATMNLCPNERLSLQQWMASVDRLEQELKLTGHYRIVFEHIKHNRQHFHIYWFRFPPSGGAAVNMGFDYRAHAKVAMELEQKYGLKASPRKDAKQPSKAKQQIKSRNARVRMPPSAVTKEVTHIYRTSTDTSEFIKNLKQSGYILTRGKNGSYVLVDKQGGYHGLLRRIEGAVLADVNRKFPELDKMDLPALGTVLKSFRPHVRRGFKLSALAINYRARPKAKSGNTKIGMPTRRIGTKAKAKLSASQATSAHFAPAGFAPKARNRQLVRAIARIRRLYPPLPSRGGSYTPPVKRSGKKGMIENVPDSEKMPFRRPEWETAELLAWAIENHRDDILTHYGMASGHEMEL